MLSALEKRDDAAYTLLKARQDLSLAQAGVQLQSLRLTEANDSVQLATLQQTRAQIQTDHYQALLDQGLLEQEIQALALLTNAAGYQATASTMSFTIAGIYGVQLAGALIGALFTGGAAILGALLAAPNQVATGLSALSQGYSSLAAKDQTRASILSTAASYERRRQEWELQVSLAKQDVEIGKQQKLIADDRVQVVVQEKVIAQLQTSNARDTIEFLNGKFTNLDLYDWMSDVLEGVYRFFLQQATAMAKLAENQLAFERQEIPPAFIQADYWDVSANTGDKAPDRRGLTGSARLSQDIYQLDQYAFDTNKRKLQLVKIISLARLAPAEFQRFRETGLMVFATPMELFDRDFPGHYLRLIKRVRTSVVALIPPTQGIHATLSNTGLSRVVIGPEVFQTVPIRRDPESVALTSPSNATGLFELEPQSDMLLPFEGTGVDTLWEFRLPRAANLFDYRTLADMLITIEYTALNSFDYRQQVIQQLDSAVSADMPFSFRNQFADPWYDLHNPDQTATPMTVQFTTTREDFPPNIDDLKIQQIVLYFPRADEEAFEIPVTHLRFTERGHTGFVGGSATSIDGVISTRRGNAGSWTTMIGKSPVGSWELALPNTPEIRQLFTDELIQDILFIITYSGRTPPWIT